jgi:THO complex subunit 1
MAVLDIAPDNAMAARLAGLLQRARALKQSTSIDPPLQVSELLSDSEPLLGHTAGTHDIQMLAVDRAAKNIFYSSLV